MHKAVAILVLIMGLAFSGIGVAILSTSIINGGFPAVWGTTGFAGGVATIVGIVLFVAGFQQLWRAHREKTAPAFMDFRDDAVRAIEVDGHEVYVRYTAPIKGKNGRPSNLNIALPATAPSSIRLSPEKAYDRFAKRIGVAVEHQTEDADFDNEVYVRSPSSQFAAEYLAAESRRDAVRRLIRSRFTEVYVEPDSVGVNWRGFNPLDEHPNDLAGDCARELLILATDIPATEIDAAQLDRGWTAVHTAAMCLLGLAAVGTAVVCFKYPPVQVWSILEPGTYVALVAVPLMAAITSLLCRGSSTAHDQWVHFLAWGIPLTIVISFCGLETVNVCVDQTEPVVHVSKVLNKREHKRRRSTSRYVTVEAWNRPNETMEISVSSADYLAAQVGVSRYEVVTSAGALGIEWICSKRLIP